jgi:hypothetical protein
MTHTSQIPPIGLCVCMCTLVGDRSEKLITAVTNKQQQKKNWYVSYFLCGPYYIKGTFSFKTLHNFLFRGNTVGSISEFVVTHGNFNKQFANKTVCVCARTHVCTN